MVCVYAYIYIYIYICIWYDCSVMSDSLCDPMVYTVLGILQARTLKEVAFPFSRESHQLRDWTQLSHIAGGLVAQLQCGRPSSISGSARSPGEATGYHSSVLYTLHIGVHAFSVTSAMSEVFVTLWAVALQAPLSIGFSRQEDWSGLPCPSPGDLPHPGSKPVPPASPALQVDSFPTEPPRKPYYMHSIWAIYCMCT